MIRYVVAAACLVAAGCSGSEPRSSTPTVVAVATTAPGTESTAVKESEPVTDRSAATAVWSVEVAVKVQAAGLDDVVAVNFDPSLGVDVDPFTEFASCSGLRSSVGTYAVSAVGTVGPIQAVSVFSSDRAVAPGVYDAEVRVEPRVGAPVSAVGTMTLDEGLRSGSFLAFDLAGKEVSGTFSCSGGGEDPPAPVDNGADDGVLDTIEVVALLRRGTSERVVSLAVVADTANGATVRCPGATEAGGDAGAETVLVDGDERIGSINTFELSGGSPMTMRLRVGGAQFDFSDVDATVDPPGSSGVFNASGDDGVTVDGAFRCT